jgi:Cys-tRNA(Pro)/Cys-tRNA(Cys) deacylase
MMAKRTDTPGGLGARAASAGTPATVALARAGIAFTVHAYEHDPRTAAFGLEAAEKLGLDPERVFKTLLANVDGSLAVGIVPVAMQLDLKALAEALGGKRAEMADPPVAERKTGYVVGGISPIGQKTALPTVLDESAILFESIYVSGGRRGLDLELAPDDLVAVTDGRYAPIARER